MIEGEAASHVARPDPGSAGGAIGVVVIGRNEGERLERCLLSLSVWAPRGIYVDSGSTDGSVDRARALGFRTLKLPVPPAFTAARARNAGLEALLAELPDLELVQMVDGDCEVRDGWIEAATRALAADPGLAAAFGRRRERYPDKSIYNALTDDEWEAPAGAAAGFGGDALIRVAALRSVDLYDATMIAGEDTELAMRMRKKGWRLERLPVEMTLHDAALLRFAQWWTRQGRGGHGFAEMAWLHPDARWPDWPRICRSIVAWGGVMPLAFVGTLVLAAAWSRWWLLASAIVLAPWPLKMAQIARAKRRAGLPPRVARAVGVLLMIGKVAELSGFLRFHLNRLAGRRTPLIEYKGPDAR